MQHKTNVMIKATTTKIELAVLTHLLERSVRLRRERDREREMWRRRVLKMQKRRRGARLYRCCGESRGGARGLDADS